MRHRPLAVPLPHQVDLVQVLRRMDRDDGAEFAGLGLDATQQVRRAGIRPMRAEADARASARAFVMLREQRQHGVEAGVGAALGAIQRRAVRGHVEPRRREQIGAGIAAQPKTFRARDEGRLLQAEHVEHRRHARAQPFEQRHFRRIADILGRHHFRREVAQRHQQREDDMPRQVTRRDIVGQATEQRRRQRVIVQVDQARHQQRAGQVDERCVDRRCLRQHIQDGAIRPHQHGMAFAQPMLRAPDPARQQKRRRRHDGSAGRAPPNGAATARRRAAAMRRRPISALHDERLGLRVVVRIAERLAQFRRRQSAAAPPLRPPPARRAPPSCRRRPARACRSDRCRS